MADRPLLTIGMPTHTDPHGVYFTVQALRLMHPEVMAQTEIIVVDQTPPGPHAEAARNFMTWVRNDVHSARYVEAREVIGTAPAKSRVFSEARGEVVVCVDSHVLLWQRSLARLLGWFSLHPGSRDLLCGPMVYDDLRGCATHLADEWRGEQWGTWAEARRCRCGMAVEILARDGLLLLRDVSPGGKTSPRCPGCGASPAPRAFQHLEDGLREAGFRSMTEDDGEPFEVWAHGTGLLACRRDAWPGFAPGMKGFGAEEVLLHERFRKRGGKVLCAPWLRWTHRFLRPDGPRYPLTRWDKVRNFVLGFRDVGLDLAPIHKHFVESGLVPEEQWQMILAGASETPPLGPDPAQVRAAMTANGLVNQQLASNHVNGRSDPAKEAAAPRVCGGCQNGAASQHAAAGPPLPPAGTIQVRQDDDIEVDIEEADVLLINAVHTAARLGAGLDRHAGKVRKWVVVRGTQLHGEKGADGGPGLFAAVRRFLRENPEWFVKSHSAADGGTTILSRDPADRRPLPSNLKMAWNYMSALALHVVSGSKVLPTGEVQRRLDVCLTCDQRTGNQCAACGCYLDRGPGGRDGKAMWPEQECPLGRWPEVEETELVFADESDED